MNGAIWCLYLCMLLKRHHARLLSIPSISPVPSIPVICINWAVERSQCVTPLCYRNLVQCILIARGHFSRYGSHIELYMGKLHCTNNITARETSITNWYFITENSQMEGTNWQIYIYIYIYMYICIYIYIYAYIYIYMYVWVYLWFK